MPTEHIVALLIAERDKHLDCRFEPGSYFIAFLATVAPLLRFRKVRANTETALLDFKSRALALAEKGNALSSSGHAPTTGHLR
jgi:hypothetical protein